MFTPTKNLFELRHRPDERKAFEDAAHDEAQETFLKGLKDEGHKTVEDYKDYLRSFSDADLFHDVVELREERDQEDDWANNPDITPEQSFRRLVACLEHIIDIDIHNEVIEEMQ